jgi:hypothetical protein
MSREVRRVALGWKHPVEHNPHWVFQDERRRYRGGPVSSLHAVDERFVPLYEGPLSVKQAEWDQAKAEWDAGTHTGFRFLLKYHSPEGFLNNDGTHDEPVPYTVYAADGETVEREVFFTSVADVQEHYSFEDEASSRPEADTHMPDFDVPDDQLGWCLYETVSEGTPCTPVFATAEELIEHLCRVGQDWDQTPMRRASAEQIVRTGFTVGTLVSVGGNVYRSDVDADLIAALPRGSNDASRTPAPVSDKDGSQ